MTSLEHLQTALAAVEAAIEGRATIDQETYKIGDRELRRIPMPDLLKLRNQYRHQIDNTRRAQAGSPLGRKHYRNAPTPHTGYVVVRRPESIDAEARTVDLVLSTGADVRRRDFEGPYLERLPLDGFRVAEGAQSVSLLDSHDQSSVSKVLGSVDGVRVQGGRLLGRATFGDSPEADAAFRQVAQGHVAGVSIGYEPMETRWVQERGLRVLEIVQWRLREVSLVPVPADPGATVRSAEGERDMPDTEVQTTDAPSADPPETRAGEVEALRAELAELRQATLAALGERAGTVTPAPRREGVDPSDPAHRRASQAEALAHRADPRAELSEPARAFRAWSIADHARECLERSGYSVAGLNATTAVTRALHTTSDFPLLLQDSMSKVLRDAYENAQGNLKSITRQTTNRDFRDKHRIMLDRDFDLERTNEHGEFRSGTLTESQESYRLETVGQKVGVTRQLLVNDDLGAFADTVRQFGQAAAEFEDRTLAALLESNPVLSDGEQTFSAAHSNLAAAGAVSLNTLSAARLAMRRQTGLNGARRIAVRPRWVVVPPELETVAQQQLAAIQPQTTDDVNPFSQLSLIVEPYLENTDAWYVFADNVDHIEYAYLEGEEGPQIESREGFHIDGVEFRVRLDFGTAVIDHRSMFRNDGA